MLPVMRSLISRYSAGAHVMWRSLTITGLGDLLKLWPQGSESGVQMSSWHTEQSKQAATAAPESVVLEQLFSFIGSHPEKAISAASFLRHLGRVCRACAALSTR